MPNNHKDQLNDEALQDISGGVANSSSSPNAQYTCKWCHGTTFVIQKRDGRESLVCVKCSRSFLRDTVI